MSTLLIASGAALVLSGCLPTPGGGSSGSDLAGCSDFLVATDAFIPAATAAGDSSDAYADVTEDLSTAITAAAAKATDSGLQAALENAAEETTTMTGMLRTEIEWSETQDETWLRALNVVTKTCGQEEITF
ncbi:hypothetical protein ACI3KS_14405 [Microbacterium sp. ZW T5_45]|uniref:hypothetical protein n=1 Tax=Microbacterium sp. ZW T5_45 TaxID=3378080 RepID=UPI00385489F2